MLRNRPIATPIGTASSSAIAELTAVPKISEPAPNLLKFAAHSVWVRKPRPSFETAGSAPLMIS